MVMPGNCHNPSTLPNYVMQLLKRSMAHKSFPHLEIIDILAKEMTAQSFCSGFNNTLQENMLPTMNEVKQIPEVSGPL